VLQMPEKTMVKQVISLQPMEPHTRTAISLKETARCGGPRARVDGYSVTEITAHGESMLEQV